MKNTNIFQNLGLWFICCICYLIYVSSAWQQDFCLYWLNRILNQHEISLKISKIFFHHNIEENCLKQSSCNWSGRWVNKAAIPSVCSMLMTSNKSLVKRMSMTAEYECKFIFMERSLSKCSFTVPTRGSHNTDDLPELLLCVASLAGSSLPAPCCLTL